MIAISSESKLLQYASWRLIILNHVLIANSFYKTKPNEKRQATPASILSKVTIFVQLCLLMNYNSTN